MDMTQRGPVLKTQQQLLKETQRTNELLTELLAEVRHANELAHWRIESPLVIGDRQSG